MLSYQPHNLKYINQTKKGVIYILVDSVEPLHVRYCGKTEDSPKKRLNDHLSAAKHKKTYKDNWINKVGKAKVAQYLIDETDDSDKLNELEIYYIALFKELGHRLVNQTDGGEGTTGLIHSDNTKQKISERSKEYYSNSENRLRSGKIVKDYWNNPENRKKHCTPIYQLDKTTSKIIKKWNSTREIERELKIYHAHITKVCQKKGISAGGFKWAYVAEYNLLNNIKEENNEQSISN